MSISEKFEIIADAVYEKGKGDIWYHITDNGARANYMYCFAYSNYSGVVFSKPITPTHYINHMFYSCPTMAELPSPLDFSKVITDDPTKDAYTYRRALCAYCEKLEVFPNVNMRVLGGIEEWFQHCKALHTIELLRVDENTIYSNAFNLCSQLKNITFDGVIGQNIDFKWSPLLTDASLNNITEHLKDFTAAGSGSATITFHPDIESKLGESGKAAITAKGWEVEFKTP